MMAISYEEKKSAVLAQFFEQYIENPIKNSLAALQSINNPHLPLAMMLCSIVDFYGRIFRVGYDGFPLTVNNKRDHRSFNDGEKNFIFFFSKFFPTACADKGILVFRIFRCGVLHQIFPKGAGLNYCPNDVRLIINETLPPPAGYDIPVLNLYAFKKHVLDALENQLELVKKDDPAIKLVLENMYNELIAAPDALNDFYKRDEVIKTFTDAGESIYC